MDYDKLTDEELNKLPKEVLITIFLQLQDNINQLIKTIANLNEQLREMNQKY